MRRKDKEVKTRSEIEAIIKSATVCRLGISDDPVPYIVPLCFGYKDRSLFFHCAKKGRKNTLLNQNPHVCFEIDIQSSPLPAGAACEWGMRFQSVMGTGTVRFITDPDEKIDALNIIMAQYSDQAFTFAETSLKVTDVFRVDIDEMTGKQSGF